MSTVTDSVARGVTAKLSERWSVLDFGAAGDGVTNDAPAINAAIAAAAADGGHELYFPGGKTYLVTERILFDVGADGVTLVGDGEASIIQRGDDMGAGEGVFDIWASGITIRNLKVDGDVTTSVGLQYGSPGDFNNDPQNAALTGNTSFWVHGGAQRIRFEGVTVTHTGGYSILLDAQDDDIRDVRIEGCLFENNRPHLFGTDAGDKNYGAWTGGILSQGDCRSSEGKLYAVRGLQVRGCRFHRMNGNCIWAHSYGFDTHHENFVIQGNEFSYIARDAYLAGNQVGGSCVGNTARYVGFRHTTDSDAPAAAYLTNHYAVGFDCSGYVANHPFTGNTVEEFYGGAFDLDGLRDSIVAQNTMSSSQAVARGIQTGDTSANGGGHNVSIIGNRLSGCNAGAIVLNQADGCLCEGNRIDHPSGASVLPILLYSLDKQTKNTVVRGNDIYYPTDWWCVAESDAGTGTGFDSGTANIVYGNTYRGARGEFLKDANSASKTGLALSTNDSSATTKQETTLQREGVGSTAAWKVYDQQGSTQIQFVQLQFDNGLLNVSEDGATQTGIITTAARTTLGFRDAMWTGKLMTDGFLAAYDYDGAGTSYQDADADALSDDWALLRFDKAGGKWEQSVSVSGSARVWTPFNSSPPFPTGTNLLENSGSQGSLWMVNYSNTASDRVGLGLRRARGSASSPADVQVGDRVFSFSSWGWKDGSWRFGSYIDSYVMAIDTGVVSSDLRFHTTSPTGIDQTVVTVTTAGHVLIATGADDSSGAKLQVAGFISATIGFYSAGTASDTVNVPGGGVTALSLISIRNDGAAGLTLARTSSVTRQYGFAVTSGGHLTLTDATAAAVRLTVEKDGVLSLSQRLQVLGNVVPASRGGVEYSYDSTGDGGAGWGGLECYAPGSTSPRAMTLAAKDFRVYTGTSVAERFRFTATGELLVNQTVDDGTGAKLQVTGFVSATTGVYTPSTATDSIQSPSGGVTARFLIGTRSLTMVAETAANAGLSSSGQGRIYFDSSANVFKVSENGGAYVNLVGSGGISGLTAGRVPYAASSTTLADSGNLTWDNVNQVLTVTGVTATAGIVVATAYIQAAEGFYTPSSATSAVQAPTGGVTARFLIGTRSFTMTAETAANAGLSASTQGRIYFDSTSNKFRVSENGGAYVDLIGGSGLTSVNSMTGPGITVAAGTGISVGSSSNTVTITNAGVTSLTGTSNQVSVSASTGAVTLSLPQNIHTGAAVTFYSLVASDAIQSNRSTGPAIYAPNAYIQSKGFVSSGLAAYNSIQTDSGFSCGTGSGGGYHVGATQVVNTSGQFVGTGVVCTAYGIAASGFNPYYSGTQYYGQNLGAVSVRRGDDSGAGTLTIYGGVIVAMSGL
jgi:hypothetical protein